MKPAMVRMGVMVNLLRNQCPYLLRFHRRRNRRGIGNRKDRRRRTSRYERIWNK